MKTTFDTTMISVKKTKSLRVLFFSMGCESLGVEYLAAGLRRAGHQVALIHDPALFQDKLFFDSDRLGQLFERRDELLQKALAWNADLLCFSVMTDTYRWALALAEALRQRSETPILFGGVHPTSVPERVIQQPVVDMLCVGEGDHAIVELVAALASGEQISGIANIWSKGDDGSIIRNDPRPLNLELSDLPWPAKDLYLPFTDMRNQYLIVAGRGCCFQCSFCSQSMLGRVYGSRARRIRLREPEDVVDELCWARERYGLRAVAFMDNVFGHNRAWLDRFAPLYCERVRLPFRCQGHVSNLDAELARRLKQMGCRRIKFGIQSRNEKIRREVFLRRETNEQMERTLDICDSMGLPYHVDHIFTPFDQEADHREALEFYSGRRRLNKVFSYNLSYFPATPIFDHVVSQGFIDAEAAEQISEGFGNTYMSSKGVGGEAVDNAFCTYGAMYRLVPLLNRRVARLLLRLGAVERMGLLPTFAHTVLDLGVAVLRRDMEFLQYGVSMLESYARNLLKPVELVELPADPGVFPPQ